MTKPKILIVDDDQANLNLVSEILGDEYSLHFASNGKIALDTVNNLFPDVILLDWNMPEMDGLSTLTAIKNNEKTKHILVVMMTGYLTQTSDLLNAYQNGVVDFIKKPFDFAELKARVNAMCVLAQFYKNEMLKKDKELVSMALKLNENIEALKDAVSNLNILNQEPSDNLNPVLGTEEIKNILKSKISETSLIQFEKYFNNVHPEFYKNLVTVHNNLSPAELKLCVLLRLNLSSKEISSFTYSTVESVKVARSRLRSKLGLDVEANLTSYLMKY